MREVDDLLFSEAMELFHYWNETNPPTCELVAGYLGFEPSRHSQKATAEEENFLMQLGPSRPFESVPPDVRAAFEAIKRKKDDQHAQ